MRSRMRWTGVAIVALVALLAAHLYSRIPDSPERALAAFNQEGGAEDQLMDPLILAGSEVIPLIEEDLVNPNVPRRRYAIGALGNIGNRAALRVLQRILGSRAEPDYIRCDALTSIALIDRPAGLQAANTYGQDGECLTELHEDLNHRYDAWRDSVKRTYIDALLGRHG